MKGCDLTCAISLLKLLNVILNESWKQGSLRVGLKALVPLLMESVESLFLV